QAFANKFDVHRVLPIAASCVSCVEGTVAAMAGNASARSDGFENAWDAEDDVFLGGDDFLDGNREACAAGGDDALHERFGCGGAGGKPERGDAVEPAPVDIVGGGDEVGRFGAGAFGDFLEADRVGGVGGADDEDEF